MKNQKQKKIVKQKIKESKNVTDQNELALRIKSKKK